MIKKDFINAHVVLKNHSHGSNGYFENMLSHCLIHDGFYNIRIDEYTIKIIT